MLKLLAGFFGEGRRRNEPPAELADARIVLGRLVDSISRDTDHWSYVREPALEELPVVQEIFSALPEFRLDVLRAVIRLNTVGDKGIVVKPHPVHTKVLWRVVMRLASRNLPYTDVALADIFQLLATVPHSYDHRIRSLVRAIERHAARRPITCERVRGLIREYIESLRSNRNRECHEFAERLDRILAPVSDDTTPPLFAAMPDSEWGEKIKQRFAQFDDDQQAHWHELFILASNAVKQNRPRKQWRENASRLVNAIGHQAFSAELVWMFENYEFDRFRTADRNAEILRGLVWASIFAEYHAPVAELGWFASKCYDEERFSYDCCARVGNACILALGELPEAIGASELLALYGRIRFETARTMIGRALCVAAEGVDKEVHELGDPAIPDLGLDAEGRRFETVGSYQAEISVSGAGVVHLRWHGPDGRVRNRIPSDLLNIGSDYYPWLQVEYKERIEREVVKQVRRLENLLFARRTRTMGHLRGYYMRHLWMSRIAANLVWAFRSGGREVSGIYRDGRFVDASGVPLAGLVDETVAFLWHPVDADVAEVFSWRDRFAQLRIEQPFEQVTREIFVVTDPEKETGAYSNRFAGQLLETTECTHVLWEQNWRGEGLWEDNKVFIIERSFPEWGIGAALYLYPVFYVRRHGRRNFNFRATDRVCFRRIDADDESELGITDVPSRVFSEVMRDINRAVAASACAENTAWRDCREREADVYYSLDPGIVDLVHSGGSRPELIEKLLPRLSIADRCSLQGEDLIVRGNLFTYRIHLGSASVFNESNGQHLCIVPSRKSDSADFLNLSFEGDRHLSQILGKAFLLAADDKIRDSALWKQIRRL